MARGNEAAFEAFYAEYSPRVFRFLRVVTGGNDDLCREVHQHVMIQAAAKLKEVGSEAQLWAWLAQVSRNKLRDVWRKRSSEERALLAMEQPVWAEPTKIRDEVQDALDSLSIPERQLLQSFYVDDFSEKELAEKTGRSVKAIQCALARVRKKLRQLIRNR